jgi:hypothetical protein
LEGRKEMEEGVGGMMRRWDDRREEGGGKGRRKNNICLQQRYIDTRLHENGS